jgi:hypothetical protein
MTEPDRDAERMRTRDVIHRLLTDAGHELARRPIHGFEDMTSTGPADYRDGIPVARRVRDYAAGIVREYVEGARGAGVPWAELAEPLGLKVGGGESAAERAFETAAPEPYDTWAPRSLRWRCETCGEMVTDTGPYNGHPDDCEEGHAATCERHQAEIRAYRASWDDE